MKIRSQIQTIAAAILLTTLMIPRPLRAAPGDVDLSFDPGSGVNGQVISVALQPDGKVLIGGMFTTVRGAARSRIARLNTDGNVDNTFNPPDLNSTVNSVVLQPDGKVLIGGMFFSLGGVSQWRIARLNADGTRDAGFTAFNPGPVVNSVALQSDGKVVVVGASTGTNFLIGRLNTNGAADASFNTGTGANGEVLSVAVQSDGRVLIAGSFTSINGTTRNRIARLNADGSLDTFFNPDASSTVRAIAVQPDGKIIIGGSFSTVAGTARNRIARLNPDGSLDTLFTPGTGANNAVRAITVQSNGKVLIGGEFTSIAGTARNRIARLNSDGSLDSLFNPGTGVEDWVRSIVVQNDGKVLFGGSFLTFAGTSRIRLARSNADGSLDPGFDPGAFVNNRVRSVVAQTDGKVLIAGYFTSINGALRNRIARLNADGTSDNSFDPGVGADGEIFCSALQSDGKVLVGGRFTSVAGSSRNRIARLNSDGSLDGNFDPGTGANSDVFSLAVQPDGKVLIGGGFLSINGTPRRFIARLNADGSLDTSFADPDLANNVYAVAIQGDGKVLIAGEFVGRIARLDTDGTLDTGFDPGTGAIGGSSGFFTAAYSVAVQPDGKLLVGGDFTWFNGEARNGITRLNADGSVDTTFDPGTGVDGGENFPAVYSVILQPDGRVVIGGDFTSFNGISRGGIARLNIDGSLDASFNPGTGANNLVFSVTAQADGKILIGGEFTSVNNFARPYVARLHADYLPSQLEISYADNLPALQLTGEVGQQYVLEYASELTASNVWTTLSSFTLTNSPQTVIDATATNAQQRIYRARVVTP